MGGRDLAIVSSGGYFRWQTSNYCEQWCVNLFASLKGNGCSFNSGLFLRTLIDTKCPQITMLYLDHSRQAQSAVLGPSTYPKVYLDSICLGASTYPKVFRPRLIFHKFLTGRPPLDLAYSEIKS